MYCLDTNVYIEAHRRYYAFDIAPGFWTGLEQLARNQIICSPMMVYDEISKGKPNDQLTLWSKDNKTHLFIEMDDSTQEIYKRVADWAAQTYEPQHVQTFLDGADPWVIAYAGAHQRIVVTIEVLKKENVNPNGKIGGEIKIPNVCRHFQIQYQDTFALLRDQKIVLR